MLNGNIFACKYVISFIVVSKVLTFSPFQLDQKKKERMFWCLSGGIEQVNLTASEGNIWTKVVSIYWHL